MQSDTPVTSSQFPANFYDRRRILATLLTDRGAASIDRFWLKAPQALLQCSWHEGVTALLAQRLLTWPGLPLELRQNSMQWLHQQAAVALRRQARLREVTTTMTQAGLPVLILKGAALACWLYPAPGLREASDADLLLPCRSSALHAAHILEKIGYHPISSPGHFQHALTCRSVDGQLDLDLHWALSDWPVLDRLPQFAELMAQSRPLPALGTEARGLGNTHALLHASIHRASNLNAGLGDRLKWLYDLDLLTRTLTQEQAWPLLLEQTHHNRLAGLCAEALHATQALLHTPVPAWVEEALEIQRLDEPLDARRLSDWRYVQWRNFMRLRWPERIVWLHERLLPSTAHLRELYQSHQNRPALLFERLRRALRRLSGY